MTRYGNADAPYWEGLEQSQLRLPRCTGCARWMWPAGRRCGHCGTIGVEWVERDAQAAVFAWTRTWHRFGLTESLELPYTSVVAEIHDCGIRLLGLLDDPDRIDPQIGEKLIGRFGHTVVGPDQIPTILWRRAA